MDSQNAEEDETRVFESGGNDGDDGVTELAIYVRRSPLVGLGGTRR